MSEHKLLVEKGNAISVEQTNISETKIIMKWLENKFDFYSEEPVSITVKQSANSVAEE